MLVVASLSLLPVLLLAVLACFVCFPFFFVRISDNFEGVCSVEKLSSVYLICLYLDVSRN